MTNIQTTINITKHPQYNHTLLHNIPSQTKINTNIMTFLGETSTQTIGNSKLTFIFLNGSIKQLNQCLFSMSYSNTNVSL